MLAFAIFGVLMREAAGWRIGVLWLAELPDQPGG